MHRSVRTPPGGACASEPVGNLPGEIGPMPHTATVAVVGLHAEAADDVPLKVVPDRRLDAPHRRLPRCRRAAEQRALNLREAEAIDAKRSKDAGSHAVASFEPPR